MGRVERVASGVVAEVELDTGTALSSLSTSVSSDFDLFGLLKKEDSDVCLDIFCLS